MFIGERWQKAFRSGGVTCCCVSLTWKIEKPRETCHSSGVKPLLSALFYKHFTPPE